MARIFIDGFEAGDLKLWDEVYGSAVIATSVTGMDGTYCLNIPTAYQWVTKQVVADDEYYVALRYKCTGIGGASRYIMHFLTAATGFLGGLKINISGNMEALRGETTIVATGTKGFVSNNIYLIEVRFKSHASAGVLQVKVDSILEIDYSGNTTGGNIEKIRLGYDAGVYAYFDNVIVDNATWPGNTKIQAIKPTGAGNSAQWTPSTGTNYGCVDEVPASETDFVSINTTGYIDTYAAGDLVDSIESIKCVQVQALAMKEGAPTPLNLGLVVRPVATNRVSADQTVPATTSKGLAAIWELNPDTGVAWTPEEVDATEIGIQAMA